MAMALTMPGSVSHATTDSDRDGTSDADTHHDEDGLTALEEFLHGTNLFAADTDSDGVWDDLEITIGSNPTTFDSFIDSDADGAFDSRHISAQIHKNLIQTVMASRIHWKASGSWIHSYTIHT